MLPVPSPHRVPVPNGGAQPAARLTLQEDRSYNPVPVRSRTGIRAPSDPPDALAIDE